MLVQIIDKFPANQIMKHNRYVIPALRNLIGDKRRIIRKFARNCLNAWTMI